MRRGIGIEINWDRAVIKKKKFLLLMIGNDTKNLQCCCQENNLKFVKSKSIIKLLEMFWFLLRSLYENAKFFSKISFIWVFIKFYLKNLWKFRFFYKFFWINTFWGLSRGRKIIQEDISRNLELSKRIKFSYKTINRSICNGLRTASIYFPIFWFTSTILQL